MNTQNLNKNNIEIYDIGIIYDDIERDRVFMVYAPLVDSLFLADAASVEKLETVIDRHPYEEDKNMSRLVEQLTTPQATNIQKRRIVSTPSKYTKLSILPNLKCNFSCSYCYSAKGRANAEIEQAKLQTMLDFFINCERVDDKELTIFISGGGEPLLSWDKVKYIVEYGQQRAKANGLRLNLLLMTNGSNITPDIADFMKGNHVDVGVSFEILPDIQQTQRGMYEIVRSNILMMLQQGIAPSVSSVITPLNVNRMTEMANAIIAEYKGVRHLNFDPAMSNELFDDEDQLDLFYQNFEKHFFEAKQLCGEHHITLDCNVIRHTEKIFPRYCEGKLCLVPNGDISICHTVSSPIEESYQNAIYGSVGTTHPIFDQEKFHTLIDEGTNLLPECSSCIARWHCAGGCLMYRRNYGTKKIRSVCNFTQRMTALVLMSKIEKLYKEAHQTSIHNVLSEYKKHGI